VQHQSCGIAIVGCGTVGGGTARLLSDDGEYLRTRTGVDLVLKYIVDLDFSHAQSLGLDGSLFEKNLDTALRDPEVSIVVELVGGITKAKEIIEQALEAGKNVVTANKALLAKHGPELFATARKNGKTLSFEASCAGGIPIVRALYDGLIANRIDALYGIVNGTCNYILTAMVVEGKSYSASLQAAQADGLAEADPTLDVSGQDSAHKLAILAALAFGKQIDYDSIPVEGIDNLETIDVIFGQELGYIVKLLAVAQRSEEGISLRVRPAFIGTDHPLAWVSGPFNAISVYGHSVGHTMYYGRGAGASPTASAVVSDITSTALGTAGEVFEKLAIWPDITPAATQLPTEKISGRYYIRLMVKDRPGVFAAIADILGKQGISISSVLQKEPQETEQEPVVVPVVITTHTTLEGKISTALSQLNELQAIVTKSVCISIVDEHEETI
jgi:homoserine dehydrogenase